MNDFKNKNNFDEKKINHHNNDNNVSSILQMNPFHSTVSIAGLGPIYPPKLALPQDIELYKKYPFFLTDEKFLKNIFKLVEELLKISNKLEIQSLEIKDR